jgi:hypothetical protein
VTYTNSEANGTGEISDDTTFKIVLKTTQADGTKVYGLYLGTANTGDEAKNITAINVKNEAGNATNVYNVTVKVADAKTGAKVTSLKVGNTSGTINDSARTVTVTVPYGTDLTYTTVSYTISDMASLEEGSTLESKLVETATDGTKYYDVSEGFTLVIGSEDGQTVNTYTVTVKAADAFSDVPATGKWYSEKVYKAVEAGIVTGRGNGTFAPTENVTRQDFAVMLVNLMKANGVSVDLSATTTSFTDKVSNYAIPYVAYLASEGIMVGSNGKFNATSNITRQEAAVAVAKALSLTSTSGSTTYS